MNKYINTGWWLTVQGRKSAWKTTLDVLKRVKKKMLKV